MKLRLGAILLLLPGLCLANEKANVVTSLSVTAVSVSTTTPTALPTSGLSGRYKVTIQNLGAFDIFVGTFSAMTATSGFVVSRSSSTRDFPVGSGITLYGLGEANTTQGTVNARVIEYR